MNPRKSIATAFRVYIGFAAGTAFLMPEFMMAVGVVQMGVGYLLACRCQNRRHFFVHAFLMLAALGVVLFLIALSSMVVTWASDSQGIEVVFRCTIALCFLVAVLRVWLLLLPAMFEELDKFIKRLARP